MFLPNAVVTDFSGLETNKPEALPPPHAASGD